MTDPARERETLRQAVGGSPDDQAQALRAFDLYQAGNSYFEAGQDEQARAHFEQAYKFMTAVLQRRVQGRGQKVLTSYFLEVVGAIHYQLALANWQVGTDNYGEAVELLEAAAMYFQLAQHQEGQAAVWSALADLHAAIGDVSAAQKAMSEAMRCGGSMH